MKTNIVESARPFVRKCTKCAGMVTNILMVMVCKYSSVLAGDYCVNPR
jgi:hypothetical protein